MNWKFGLIFLGQLFILWLLNEIGFKIAGMLNIPIPGNVIGMMLLFICLMTGVIKLDWINEAASFLLKHLVFFFIPITVGIMTFGSIFVAYGVPLFIILFGSGILGFILTAWVTQLLGKRKRVRASHGYRNHII